MRHILNYGICLYGDYKWKTEANLTTQHAPLFCTAWFDLYLPCLNGLGWIHKSRAEMPWPALWLRVWLLKEYGGEIKGGRTTERPAPTSLLLIQNTHRVKEWKWVSWVNTVDMSVSKQVQLQGKKFSRKKIFWNTAVWKQRLRKRKGEGTLRIRATFQKEPTEPSRVGNTHAKEPRKRATHIRSETFANLNKTDSSVPEKLVLQVLWITW